MNNMIQDEKTLEELVKTADSFRKFFADLADEISKVLADIKAPKEEDTWEMKCPYKDRDKYYIVNSRGLVKFLFWDNCVANKKTFNQGHIFPTKEAAELEAKRRNLLTRFRAFRDECNNGWKPDWSNKDEVKVYIQYYVRFKRFVIKYTTNCDMLQTFGFFQCKQDAKRAIDLFGDEIKELFVEGE